MMLKPISLWRANTGGGGNFAGVTSSSTGFWHDTVGGTGTLTSHAFSIGTAFSDRVCYAFIFNRFDETITAVTIGGVTASVVGDTTGGGGGFCSVFRAVVPTGTTATVATTYSGTVSANAGGNHLYYARDCTEANINTSNTTADPWQFSINPAAGSSILSGSGGNNFGGVTPTGVGVTVDMTFDVASSDWMVTGSANSVSAGAANYGHDFASAGANGGIVVFEVKQAV